MIKKGTKLKQFCPKGHDTFVNGRTTQGRCRICQNADNIKRYVPHPRSNRFCKYGHDTFITGRNKNHGCIQCIFEKTRVDPSKDSRKTQFCPKGHDKDVVGRTKVGACQQCAKECMHSPKHKKALKLWKADPNNQDKIKQHRRTYYAKHKRQLLKRQHKYTVTHRKQTNRRHRMRRKNDPKFKLLVYLRTRLNRAIKINQKKGSAIKDLGCSIEFLKQYIESKFYGKMTWKNWGEVWELDHIKALFKFDLMDRKQFLKAVNYKNLQPLTIKAHRIKTNREMLEWQKLNNKK
jgi:hypothetical protein